MTSTDRLPGRSLLMGVCDLYGPADETESIATIHAGARRRDRLTESLAAVELELSAGDLEAIEAAVPADAVAGTRYDAAQMAFLDSERR